MKYLYSTYKFFQLLVISFILFISLDIITFISLQTFLEMEINFNIVLNRFLNVLLWTTPTLISASLIFSIIMIHNKEIEEENPKRYIFIIATLGYIILFTILNFIITKNNISIPYDFFIKNELLQNSQNLYLFNDNIFKLDFFKIMDKIDLIKVFFSVSLYFLKINYFYFILFAVIMSYLIFILKRFYIISNWPMANFVFGGLTLAIVLIYISLISKFLKPDFIILFNIIFIIVLKFFYWRNDHAFKYM